jgi:hypothetical protein
MRPTTTPSAKAEASDAIGRSEMMLSRLPSCSFKVSPRFIQRNLDLLGESLGAIFGGVEDALAGGVQKPRQVAFQGLQLVSQLALVEHRSCLAQ